MKRDTSYLIRNNYDKEIRNNKCFYQSALIISVVCCVCLLIGLILALTLKNASNNPCESKPNNQTQQNLYLHAAVSADSGPCANVASNIMITKGGNAVDSAIAGLLCDCTINFHSCGIAGGSLIVIYIKKENKVYAVDIREEAPASAYKTMFNGNPKQSLTGGKSIAVMGLVAGYYEIHQKFGNLNWPDLLQPSIDILNTGFYVSKTIEAAIDYFVENANKTQFKELWTVISDPQTGKPKRFGDIIKNEKLSKTLTILAKEPYAMKNGSLVDVMIREIKAAGGNITRQDLAQYSIKWRDPVSVQLSNGEHLYTLPPPSSGALIAFTLNVLAEYAFDSSYLDSCSKAGLFFHRFIETMKFAYAKRSALGDMDFVDVKKVLADLTSDNYAKWIKTMITDDRTHPVSYYNTSYVAKEDHGTSHFSLLGQNGDAVSATSTINFLFGSLVMGNETGILYNDEMDDFSTPNKSNIYNLPPSPSNFIEPGKRPMSSMSPIIIVNKSGDVTLVTGASGGSKIISSTALVATLTTLLKREIKPSIDQPRAHHQLIPDYVEVETNFPKGLIGELTRRGHAVVVDEDHAVVQGVQRTERSLPFIECNADFRKMGQCDGF